MSSTSVSILYEGMPRLPATSSDVRSPQQCDARSPRHGQPAFGSQNMKRFRVPFRLFIVSSTLPGLAPMDGLLSATSCLESRRNNHGMVGVVVLMVQVQHVLHSSHELPAHLRDAPFLLRPRLDLSTWRTVSKEMSRQTPSPTFGKPASSACVLRAHRQAMATSALPAYRPMRLCPGRGRSMSALSSPSCTYRVRKSDRGDCLINSPLASRSIRPSSAFSNTSARLTLRAEVSRLAICLRCVRSDSFNSSLYRSHHVFVCPPYRIIHKTNLFLIFVKYT